MAAITVGMASFARFYEAADTARVRITRDMRYFDSDPRAYRLRNYYRDFFNTVRDAHWREGNLDSLPAALEKLYCAQKVESKRDNFEALGTAYLEGWEQMEATPFVAPRSSMDIEDVRIRVTPEIGMQTSDELYVLKLWLNAPKPTRRYRQAIEYMLTAGRGPEWDIDWQARIWDVRRQLILPPMKLPADFQLGFESAVVAFKQLWFALGPETDEEEEEDFDW